MGSAGERGIAGVVRGAGLVIVDASGAGARKDDGGVDPDGTRDGPGPVGSAVMSMAAPVDPEIDEHASAEPSTRNDRAPSASSRRALLRLRIERAAYPAMLDTSNVGDSRPPPLYRADVDGV